MGARQQPCPPATPRGRIVTGSSLAPLSRVSQPGRPAAQPRRCPKKLASTPSALGWSRQALEHQAKLKCRPKIALGFRGGLRLGLLLCVGTAERPIALRAARRAQIEQGSASMPTRIAKPERLKAWAADGEDRRAQCGRQGWADAVQTNSNPLVSQRSSLPMAKSQPE
jgi:hypothetical protein